MIPFVFQNPRMLLLLVLVLPLWWILSRAQRRRDAVHLQMDTGRSERSAWRDWLRLAAVTLLLLALARPGINPQRHSVSRSGRDVVFVLDVSQSMLARDAFPSRLDAAKDGIRDALDSFHRERVALVVYAGSANILAPLTYDYEFVRYMLDQATPRAVDFGGTTLLSATEKCVDTILTDERKGMQDLVVLTDGGDHGPQNANVARLLKQQNTGLLVLGLGDSTAGARIPIEAEDGSIDYLKHDDQIVTTRLNESGLHELIRLSDDASYVPVGTAGFDLAGLYSQFAGNKPVADTAGSESYVVYSEVGFLLIGIALALLLLTEIKLPRIRRAVGKSAQAVNLLLGAMAVVLASNSFVIAEELAGGLGTVEQGFADAVQLQEQGLCTDALEAYELIEAEFAGEQLTPARLATLRVNQGLCQFSLAVGQNETAPRSALSLAQNAQMFFLEACRVHPGFNQASKRLDPTASLIVEIKQQIQEENEREQELQEQLQGILKLLQKLQADQIGLRETIPILPAIRRVNRKGQPPVEPLREPANAALDSRDYTQQQRKLSLSGTSILEAMRDFDLVMAQSDTAESDQAVSMLREPIQIMMQAVEAQETATEKLRQWNTWPACRDQQQLAIARIQEILDILSSDNSADSDEGDWDDEEEYDEMMDQSDSDNSMMSSMEGQGDFSAGSAMQPLPVPNYSVQDILQEEQGSLQFRQQQRAKGNQSKVEKDW